jgi:hypothetical protein
MASKRPLSEINTEKKSHKKMLIPNNTSNNQKISKTNSPDIGMFYI